MAGFQTTPERRANLVKLARFLYTEPIEERRFNMSLYAPVCVAIPIANCGFAGCAVGWAPSAGIQPLAGEEWSDFAARTLISFKDRPKSFGWCFDGCWDVGDNTPKGAAKRILWLLLFGVPSDWLDQQAGENDLCYRDWTPTESDWQRAATP